MSTQEEVTMGIVNLTGHNALMQTWADFILQMYGDNMKRNDPALVQKLAAIRTFSKGVSEVLGRYMHQDDDTIDLFTKHLGSFFNTLKKADSETKGEFFAALDDLQIQLDSKVNG